MPKIRIDIKDGTVLKLCHCGCVINDKNELSTVCSAHNDWMHKEVQKWLFTVLGYEKKEGSGGEGMKLWAVVIGSKKVNTRYIIYNNYPNQLAAYEKRHQAWEKRRQILKHCGHKDVYVIPFESK